jgi:hypothetical protein
MLPSMHLSSRRHAVQALTHQYNFYQGYSKRRPDENALPRGRESQAPATLLDVQEHLWDCPPRSRQPELAHLQECEKTQLLQAKGNAGRWLTMQKSQRRCALVIFQATILLQSPASPVKASLFIQHQDVTWF